MLAGLGGTFIGRALDEKLGKLREALGLGARREPGGAPPGAARAVVDRAVQALPEAAQPVATRIARYAEAGIRAADAVTHGVALAADLDADELAGRAQTEVLLRAAGALVTQGTPGAASALALLYDG